MARLIDADTFRSNICCCDIETYNDKLTIIEQINEAPTVDAVQVVRCDVCKNAEPYDCAINGTVRHLYKCKKDEGAIGYNKVVSNYDFCSCGKRKDGDGNGLH